MMSELVDGYELDPGTPGTVGPDRVQLRILDLFLWAVASGRAEMAATLWRRCAEPTRAALVACEMCVRIRRLQSHNLAVTATRTKLERIERECKEAVTGVLDNVRDAVSARAILLSQNSTLGVSGERPCNLLELGIHLQSENFVGHPWNQAILDEQWCGRDARCGKVMLRRLPDSTALLALQTALNLFGVQLLELQSNPEYKWGPGDRTASSSRRLHDASVASLNDGAAAGGGGGRGRGSSVDLNDSFDQAREGSFAKDVLVFEQVLHYYRIPAVKHMATLLLYLVRYVLFIRVALTDPNRRLQPFSKETVFCVWMLSPFLEEVLQVIELGVFGWWRRWRNRVDATMLGTLLTGLGLRCYLGFRETYGGATLSDDGEDTLRVSVRVLMSLSAMFQAMKLLQLLFAYSKVGMLIAAIYEMIVAIGRTMLLFVILTSSVSTAFAVLLDGWDDDEASASGSADDNATAAAELSLVDLADAADDGGGDDPPEFGTTLAIPWFAIYGYINPSQILTPHRHLNGFVTLLLWVYMFCIQIGMLNLLIAIMTDTYFRVAQGSSLSSWRMSRVATNYEFLSMPAVPEPFNLPMLVVQLGQAVVGGVVAQLKFWRSCCCPASSAAASSSGPPPRPAAAYASSAALNAGGGGDAIRAGSRGSRGDKKEGEGSRDSRRDDSRKRLERAATAMKASTRVLQAFERNSAGAAKGLSGDDDFDAVPEEFRARDAYLQRLKTERLRAANDQAAGERIEALQSTLEALATAQHNDRKLVLEVRAAVLEIGGGRRALGGPGGGGGDGGAGGAGGGAAAAAALQSEVFELSSRLERKLDEFKSAVATMQRAGGGGGGGGVSFAPFAASPPNRVSKAGSAMSMFGRTSQMLFGGKADDDLSA